MCLGILYASLLWATPFTAQAVVTSPTWTLQSPNPTGQPLYDVDMISATEAWAVGSYGTIIRTSNGGRSWTRQRSNTNQDLRAVHFEDSLHGWAVGNVALYTVDGGTTWQKGAGALGTLYSVDFADVSTGFAGVGANFLYKTIDGGRTWTKVNVPLSVTRVQFFDSTNGVAGGAGGVLHTSDAGKTWNAISGAHGGFFLNHQEGWALSGNSAERTVDGGRTWQRQGLPAAAWMNDTTFVDNLNGWGAGAESGIVHTEDGGITWKMQRGGIGSANYNKYPLEGVDFADSLHGLTVGACGIIFSTSDGGASWMQRLSGSCTATNALAAIDVDHAWAANQDGELLRTVNGGKKWSRANLPTGDLGDVDFIDNLNGWTVSQTWTTGDQFIFRTGDGGKTWKQTGPHDASQLWSIDAIDSSTIVAVGYACCTGPTITRSTDGGVTWAVLPHPPGSPFGRFRDVTFTTATTGWIVGDSGALLKSADAGVTWTQQQGLIPDTFLHVSFADPLNGWITASDGGDGYLLHTTDGGKTWVRQTGVPGYNFATFAVSPSTVWISGDGGVASSIDGGRTFSAMSPWPNGSFAALQVVAGTTVWAAGNAVSDPGPSGLIVRRPN